MNSTDDLKETSPPQLQLLINMGITIPYKMRSALHNEKVLYKCHILIRKKNLPNWINEGKQQNNNVPFAFLRASGFC